ncbi:MAG: HEPN domain-containing protein [Sideroxydans sp.]|nr:HEPN domain-containing protein [Sideroxydans sp.]
MSSNAFQIFQHSIQDANELLNHFDGLNKNPPPPNAEVLKRASLVMALAALETYFEDRIVEAVSDMADASSNSGYLVDFYISSLENDLKYFHTPSVDRVRTIFQKYLGIDITEGWAWNHFEPSRAKSELNKIAKKRGDIAHRSLRPQAGNPTPHAVTRDELRKHIRFVCDLVDATDKYLQSKVLHLA